jgi:Bacterial Ig-like domain (group 2)
MRPMRRALVVPKSIAAVILLGLLILSGCSSGLGSSNTTAPPAATLQSIQISPTNPSVAAGTSIQFTATALYSDNSHADVTTQVVWNSSGVTVATVGVATGDAAGLVPGFSTLSASFQGQSASTKLTVTAATLVSIELSPASPRLAAGTTQAFTATGTFSNHTTQNLTADVRWSLSDSAVATLSSLGLATGLSAGSATIKATCAVASICGLVSGSTTLTVTGTALVSIAVTAPALSIALGTTQQFTATGTYADHSTQNLTTQVTWASSTGSVATVSNVSGAAGLATSVAAGTTLITASLSGVSSAAVTLTVTAATLVSIAIIPANPSIALGTTVQLTATGTYTDSSTRNLTSQATWASSAGSTATVSNASGSNGLATSVATGSTIVTAAFGTVTSAPQTLTVTAATLVSIAITPANPSVVVGNTIQFTATGSYTDSSTQDLTAQVMWASDTHSVATISNVSGTQGLASSLTTGTANISAILGSIAAASVPLSVEPPSFTTPGSYTWTVPANVTSIQIVATGGGGGGAGTTNGVGPGAPGGSGALVTELLSVTPGQLIALVVGGGAGAPAPGWGGACSPGGGGGGASSFDSGNADQIIAGGGGGGGSGCGQSETPGGNGGGAGGAGGSGGGSYGGAGGSGGTGGADGEGTNAGGNGDGGPGGAGGSNGPYPGGNGGSGAGLGAGGTGLSCCGGGGGGGYGGGGAGGGLQSGGAGGSTGPSGTIYSAASNAGAASASGGDGSIVITIE